MAVGAPRRGRRRRRRPQGRPEAPQGELRNCALRQPTDTLRSGEATLVSMLGPAVARVASSFHSSPRVQSTRWGGFTPVGAADRARSGAERRDRMTAVNNEGPAQNGTSGALADGKHARRHESRLRREPLIVQGHPGAGGDPCSGGWRRMARGGVVFGPCLLGLEYRDGVSIGVFEPSRPADAGRRDDVIDRLERFRVVLVEHDAVRRELRDVLLDVG